MARYTGPVWKKARRLSFSVLETGEELKKRTYAPGQHGPTKRVKLSNYGTQLREKQRVRNMFDIKILFACQTGEVHMFVAFTKILMQNRTFFCKYGSIGNIAG
jgi:hypothetical protein